MAKKNRGFTWTREDQDEEPLEVAQRRDIHEERALKQRLKEAAQRLGALQPEKRAHLPLDAELRAAVNVLAVQGPKPSRRRQLLHVQKLLRNRDLEAIEAALNGEISENPHSPVVQEWQRRLTEEGDAAIQDFINAHPDADRQQLRTMCRQMKGEGKAARRARRNLLKMLAATVED